MTWGRFDGDQSDINQIKTNGFKFKFRCVAFLGSDSGGEEK